MLSFDEFTQLAALFPSNLAETITRPGLFLSLAGGDPFVSPIRSNSWAATARSCIGRAGAPAPPRSRLSGVRLDWAIVSGITFCLGVVFILRGQSEFIYFNF